jgi:hypothetical protein
MTIDFSDKVVDVPIALPLLRVAERHVVERYVVDGELAAKVRVTVHHGGGAKALVP